MSFYTEVESQPKANDVIHLPKSIRTNVATKGTIKDHVILPPVCSFTGQQRLKPQSSFSSTGLFAAGSQLDYWLTYNGFLEQLRLELQLQVSGSAANPLTVLGPYLLDRIEIYDSNQNIAQTWYADNLYFQRIFYGKDKSAAENQAEGVSNSTYGPIGPLAAGTKFNLEINIPCCFADTQLKGNIIDGKNLIRVYFSANGVISGAATDLICNLADIIQHAEQLSGALESKEVNGKRMQVLNYRCLNPTRVASFAISNAQPSQYYDIQLVSGTQMSALLYFVVRPTPITNSTVQSYVQLSQFEFYDQSVTLQGVTQLPENNRWVVAQKFGGDIFNVKAGIYVIPFAISIKKAINGDQTGFYKLSTREIIRVYMPSTLTAGNYQLDCYSYDYAEMTANMGKMEFKK